MSFNNILGNRFYGQDNTIFERLTEDFINPAVSASVTIYRDLSSSNNMNIFNRIFSYTKERFKEIVTDIRKLTLRDVAIQAGIIAFSIIIATGVVLASYLLVKAFFPFPPNSLELIACGAIGIALSVVLFSVLNDALALIKSKKQPLIQNQIIEISASNRRNLYWEIADDTNALIENNITGRIEYEIGQQRNLKDLSNMQIELNEIPPTAAA
jgi:hypothetical protein